MAHTFTQLNATDYLFKTGNIQFLFKQGFSPEHTACIQILTSPDTGEAARTRLEELMTWNHNFAFAIFCSENNVIIAPPTPEETETI